MICNLKRLSLSTVFFIITTAAFAQLNVKADGTGLFARLTDFAGKTPGQNENVILNANYKLVKRYQRKVDAYDATFAKYRLADSADSFLIISYKEQVLNAIYITYSQAVRDRVLSDAIKAGYVLKKQDGNEDMYALAMMRLIILTDTNPNRNKPFYTIGVSDLAIAEKVRAEANKH